MVEMRTRKLNRRQRREKILKTLEDLSARSENRKVQLARLNIFRNKFKREVQHQRRGNVRTKKQAVTGESVVKFYDDIIKEKDHVLDMIVLSNENVTKKYKALGSTLRELSDAEHSTTVYDVEKMKVENHKFSLTIDEKKREYRTLQTVLGECVYNEKMLTKKLEEAEEVLEGRKRESVTYHRISIKKAEEIATMKHRRETTRIE